MANERTIPALPCRSINETLAFYVALGFEITYQQARPNNYGCVKFEDIDLHFFTLKGYEPKDSYSTCLVLVPDLVGLHQTFSANLRAQYGKLPVAGIPRISKLNNSNSAKQLRFNIIDPGGNWIRFIQAGEQPAESEDAAPEKAGQSKLSRATQSADWLVEALGDFEAAAQMLDKALAQNESAPAVHRVQAMVLRASVAVSMDDHVMAKHLLDEARQMPLEDDERVALVEAFEKADDLEKMIG
jgi:catechol 2,3-dioxygenase-like lactoylglutathione lyase family enzyme